MKKQLIIALLMIGLLSFAPRASAAIAFDASSTYVTGASVTNVTTTITISGGLNEMLFALVFTTNNDASATFNGTPMTKEVSLTVDASRAIALFALPAPTSGAHLITCSVPSSEALVQCGGTSYSGVLQSTMLDATTTNATTTNVSSFTTTLTTVANNDWSILGVRQPTGGMGGSASTTLRFVSGATSVGLGDTNGAKTPAGSQSMTVTGTSGNDFTVMAAFSPAATSDALFFGGD